MKALMYELSNQGLKIANQVEVPVKYRGEDLGTGFRADIIVEESLLLELKCVEQLSNLHMSQTITYLKLLNMKRGLLINFNNTLLKNGIKRISI